MLRIFALDERRPLVRKSAVSWSPVLVRFDASSCCVPRATLSHVCARVIHYERVMSGVYRSWCTERPTHQKASRKPNTISIGHYGYVDLFIPRPDRV
jgi:hypothetical protein